MTLSQRTQVTSDPGILTPTVYSWTILHKYLQFGLASSAAVIPHSHHTHLLSPCPALGYSITPHPPGSATSLHPHYTWLSLGPHATPVLPHLPMGQILQRPQARWRAPHDPFCFPSSLIICTTLCPACPKLEPPPDGGLFRC